MSGGSAAPPPPAGFEPVTGRGGFWAQNGPYFYRTGLAEGVEHALLVEPGHINIHGVLHGGMLSAFFDSLLGAAAVKGAGRSAVTVSLSVDFLRMARRGEWLMGAARMTRATRELAFTEGHALVGSRVIGRASGVFKLMGRAG